ncbi:MAG: hypothetical protein HZA24_12560 [Nitrospirae bacterium]|nr:hypothetical protein [Nitrospirota bacterium]
MAGGTPPRANAELPEAGYGEEIDLFEYWSVLWRRRWMVTGVALLCAVLAGGGSFLMPNVYRAEALLAPVAQEGAAMPGGLLGGLGGLGALAGVLPAGGGGVEENLAVLQSRDFIWAFVREKDLLPVLFADDWDAARGAWRKADPDGQPDLWDAYRLFAKEGLLTVSADRKSGLVTVAVEWTDPELAAQWANDLVARLNAYLRQRQVVRSEQNLSYLEDELRSTQVDEMRKALFELIGTEQKKAMLARTQKEFAFQVLDQAASPDIKARPRRGLMVVLAGMVGGVAGVFWAFLAQGIRHRRETAPAP